MATIRWRRGKDGRLWATLIWKVGRRQHTKALHTTDPIYARSALASWKTQRGAVGPTSTAQWSWSRALDAFLLRVGETASPTTVGCYRGHLRRLFDAWGETPGSEWTPEMFRAHVAARPHWKPRTKQLVTHAAKRFIEWARKAGWPVADFVGDYRAPKIVVQAPEILTDRDFTAFVRAAEDMDGEVAVALSALAGLRLGEVARAEWADYRPVAGTLRVRGRKGHAERLLPVSPALRRILKRQAQPEGLMVPESHADKLRPQLKRIAKVAGLRRFPTLRVLRHCFASRLVAAGVDIATVQALLGHKSPAMTLRYSHSDPERTRAAVAKVLG